MFPVMSARVPLLALALALGIALPSAPAHAQDATRTFTGRDRSQPDACAAAERAIDAWLRQGKADGRRRSVADRSTCACTPADGAVDCRIQAQVSDEAYEPEEEDR